MLLVHVVIWFRSPLAACAVLCGELEWSRDHARPVQTGIVPVAFWKAPPPAWWTHTSFKSHVPVNPTPHWEITSLIVPHLLSDLSFSWKPQQLQSDRPDFKLSCAVLVRDHYVSISFTLVSKQEWTRRHCFLIKYGSETLSTRKQFPPPHPLFPVWC